MSIFPEQQTASDEKQPGLARRIQFQIRHLGIFVAILTMVLAALTFVGAGQRVAVAEIRSFGGSVRYENDKPDSEIARWAAKHLGLDLFYSVIEVDLVNSDYGSTKWIKHLEALPNIETLSIKGKQVDDEVLKLISELESLERLSVSGLESADDWGYDTVAYTGITNSGLQHLAITKLKSLEIFACALNDESLEMIREIASLNEALLTGTFSKTAVLEFRSGRLEPSRFQAVDISLPTRTK